MLAGLAAVLLVGVSSGHAAPVQNTAAEAVSPFFSTGTSSNMSQTKTGFISLSGSGDDLQGDSGSASAQVNYGVIRLNGQFQGRGGSDANATFADNVTFTAPGIAPGTFGTFNCQISVGGVLSVSLTSPTVLDEAAWALIGNIGDRRFNSQLRHGGTLSSETGQTGDAFGLFTDTITFQFGVPMPLAVTLEGTAEGSVAGQSASFDLSHSLYWAGINGVTNNGQLVTDFSVSSDSGTDWSRSFVPIPEPSSIVLMTVLGSLLFAWRLFDFWKNRPVGL